MNDNTKVVDFEFGTLKRCWFSKQLSSFDEFPNIQVRTINPETAGYLSFFYQINLNTDNLKQYDRSVVEDIIYSQIMEDLSTTPYRYERDFRSEKQMRNDDKVRTDIKNIVNNGYSVLKKFSTIISFEREKVPSATITLTNLPRDIQIGINKKSDWLEPAPCISNNFNIGSVVFYGKSYPISIRCVVDDVRQYVPDDVLIETIARAFNEAFPFAAPLTGFKIHR